jgi:transposase InsO family protein
VFTRVCEENGIIHHVTPPRRPELHGLAENFNRVVFRMANSFLYNSRISHLLWAAAVGHANAVRNRLPVRGLGEFTPYELFFKKRPRLHE